MRGRAFRQTLAIVAGLSLWSITAHAEFWALVLAYLVAVLLLGWLDALPQLTRLAGTARVAVCALLLLPGVWALGRARSDFALEEGLEGLSSRLTDRLRVEAEPSIAPPLVVADRPQTFFVHAPGGSQLRVRFGVRTLWLTGVALGEGLFRVAYDPRRDGLPVPTDGELGASIEVDGHVAKRTLQAATALAHPRWLQLSHDRTRACTVSEETDELFIVTPDGLLAKYHVGEGPTDCAFLDADHVAVSHRGEEAVWRVDIGSGTHSPLASVGAGQLRLQLSPDGGLLAVARRAQLAEVALVSTQQPSHVTRIPLALPPDWLAFGADATTLVVSTRADAALHLFVLRAGLWREEQALHLGRPAVTLARARAGQRLWVATTDYRPDGSPQMGNHFVQDQVLTIDVQAFRVVHQLLTARRSPRQSKAGDVDRGVSPMGLAEGADGSEWIAFAGTDELWRIREGQEQPEIIDLVDVPLHAPHGLAEFADGTLVVSSPSQGTFGLLPRAGTQPRVVRVAPEDDALLRHNRVALARRIGERGFYEATRAGISCQSCHLHGDSDERAHNLGDHRLMPTLTVRGLLGTGPYLRDGSYVRLRDLDHVAQTLYRGYLRRAPGRPETLEAFVESLPRYEPPHDTGPDELARQRRGLHVFVSAGCETCHAFPAFTGFGQQLLASLFPQHDKSLPSDALLDTPSLLSVVSSPPYLNDGRARTLRAVLVEHNRANRHGDSAGLSERDRGDLLAFLECL